MTTKANIHMAKKQVREAINLAEKTVEAKDLPEKGVPINSHLQNILPCCISFCFVSEFFHPLSQMSISRFFGSTKPFTLEVLMSDMAVRTSKLIFTHIVVPKNAWYTCACSMANASH